jgi:hypothetical protein
MQVGCGVYAHTVRGRAYLYFWHYEARGGRRVQIKEYVGPATVSKAHDEARRRCEAYYAHAALELERMRRETLATIGAS